jgi:hypothetical protein
MIGGSVAYDARVMPPRKAREDERPVVDAASVLLPSSLYNGPDDVSNVRRTIVAGPTLPPTSNDTAAAAADATSLLFVADTVLWRAENFNVDLFKHN